MGIRLRSVVHIGKTRFRRTSITLKRVKINGIGLLTQVFTPSPSLLYLVRGWCVLTYFFSSSKYRPSPYCFFYKNLLHIQFCCVRGISHTLEKTTEFAIVYSLPIEKNNPRSYKDKHPTLHHIGESWQKCSDHLLVFPIFIPSKHLLTYILVSEDNSQL